MREDIWRFTGVIFFSLLVGLASGQVVICLLAGIVLFMIWQYRVLKQLYEWLQYRNESDPPELPGIINEICREIEYLRIRHKQRKEKLSGFLKRFQEATAALPDAVVVLGENGEIEWANEKAGDYLGIRWPQDGRQRILNLIRNPELISYLNQLELEQQHSDKALQIDSPINTDLKLEIRITPYGEIQKLLVARDVTTIQRIHQMRKDFIANASHELRTPLTVISGYLEEFADDMEVCPETWKPHLEQMRKQSERMRRLINDLLQLSSLEMIKEHEETEPVMVPDLLTSVYQEAQTMSGMMEHIFYLDTDPELWIRGNQRELYSAFSNLVNNAVQHTSERGIIRIHWYADKEGAHLEVADNGEGIAPEHIPRITERFYRVDKDRSREKGGTGLGLAIVKHVLARHGGNLHIDSRLGKGSTFRCDFPARIIVYKSKNAGTSLSA